MDTKHEALKTADRLNVFFATVDEDDLEWDVVTEAADLLRSQHARIEELERALGNLTAQIDASKTSADFAALQEHQVMRNARDLLTKKD